MTVKTTIDPVVWLRNRLDDPDGESDLLAEMLKAFAETLMSAEASTRCGAEYGERTDERVNSRNGYRERRGHSGWHDRAGRPETPSGHLLPGVAPAPPSPFGTSARDGDRPGLPWTRADGRDFAKAAWNYLGYT